MIEYEKILTKLVELKEKDDRIDDLFKGFLEAISPEQNSPYVEFNAVSGYMECLSILNKPLYEELTYFIYEAYNMKDGGSIETMEGKKYKIKTIEDMVDYLEKEF